MTLPKNPENEAIYQQKENYLSTNYCVGVFLDEYMLYVADLGLYQLLPYVQYFIRINKDLYLY